MYIFVAVLLGSLMKKSKRIYSLEDEELKEIKETRKRIRKNVPRKTMHSHASCRPISVEDSPILIEDSFASETNEPFSFGEALSSITFDPGEIYDDTKHSKKPFKSPKRIKLNLPSKESMKESYNKVTIKNKTKNSFTSPIEIDSTDVEFNTRSRSYSNASSSAHTQHDNSDHNPVQNLFPKPTDTKPIQSITKNQSDIIDLETLDYSQPKKGTFINPTSFQIFKKPRKRKLFPSISDFSRIADTPQKVSNSFNKLEPNSIDIKNVPLISPRHQQSLNDEQYARGLQQDDEDALRQVILE